MKKELTEYINKGISHFKEEINKLGLQDKTKSRSTKYNYFDGAITALNNMLVYVNSLSEPIEQIKNEVEFRGILPVLFYNASYYELLVGNAVPVLAFMDNRYVVVGEARSSMPGDYAIHIEGKFFVDKKIIQQFTTIKNDILGDKPLYILLPNGEINFELVGD